jgi:hypothetical protein
MHIFSIWCPPFELRVTSMYRARLRAFQEEDCDNAMSAFVIHIYQN